MIGERTPTSRRDREIRSLEGSQVGLPSSRPATDKGLRRPSMEASLEASLVASPVASPVAFLVASLEAFLEASLEAVRKERRRRASIDKVKPRFILENCISFVCLFENFIFCKRHE